MDSSEDDPLADEPTARAATASRIILGSQLRQLRENARISRGDAGYAIRGSASKISRLELGRVSFKKRDVADLLTTYGIHDPVERQSLLRLVDESSEPGWWKTYSDVLPYWFSGYMGLEESASRILSFELQYVPGLLQTEDYARAVVRTIQAGTSRQDIDRRVTLRMRRQRILNRPDGPRLWVVIDESALRRPIGSKDVLRAQLAALLDWTMLPNIALQVLPFERAGNATNGAFSMLRFNEPELPDIVYIEHLTGSVYLDKLDEVECYGRSIDQLAVDAEPPDRSAAFIAKLLAET